MTPARALRSGSAKAKYLYTDGVTEAEDEKHNLYGEERLLKCFQNKNESNSTALIEHVKESIDEFINGNGQFDDITMLCFKWKEKI